MAAYQVKLPVFEGPFDLLYHLITEQEVDIYDIPIAKITAQYLEYIQMMEILDMDVASEFLVMAANLIEIKSKMLLPKEKPQDFDSGDEFIDEAFADDPRQQLVEQLLEYKRFKLVAEELRDMERRASRIFTRTCDMDIQPEEILEINIGPIELLDVYHTLLRRRLEPPIHRVVLGKLSIIDRIKEIRTALKKFKGEITFARLLKKKATRYDTVISFMAVLEMIKAGEIGCDQNANFEPIVIYQGKKDEKVSEDEYLDEKPDDVSKMPMAKNFKRADDDIKSIKINDIPEELLQFKTPSQLEAERKAAAEAALAAAIEAGLNPETPDLVEANAEGTSATPEAANTVEVAGTVAVETSDSTSPIPNPEPSASVTQSQAPATTTDTEE